MPYLFVHVPSINLYISISFCFVILKLKVDRGVVYVVLVCYIVNNYYLTLFSTQYTLVFPTSSLNMQHKGEIAKTGWLRIMIMCQEWSDMSTCWLLFQSVSIIKKLENWMHPSPVATSNPPHPNSNLLP